MTTRILAIAPYRGLAELLRCTAAEIDEVELTVVVADWDSGLRAALEADMSKYDVMISRGGTARLITSHIDAPVVELDISLYDILRAIRHAENYGVPFAIIGYANITKRAHILCDLLRYSCEICTASGYEETYERIEELKSRGYQHVICDVTSQRAAADAGISAILITSSEESVRDAVVNAVRMHRSHTSSPVAAAAAAFRQISSGRCRYIELYDDRGRIPYSTLDDAPDADEIREVSSDARDRLLRGETDEWERIWRGARLSVRRESVHLAGGDMMAMIYSISPVDKLFGRNRAQITNRSDVAINVVDASRIYLGDQGILARRSAESSDIVLITGEHGCGKNTVAELMYLNSRYSSRPMISIDFSASQGGDAGAWRRSSSPLYGTGRTILLKRADALAAPMLVECMSNMKESGAAARNKILISIEVKYGEHMESEAFRIVSEQSGCACLHLRPLRERADELSNICSVLLNEMNIDYGGELIGLEPDALAMMQDLAWPGNIGQLRIVLRELMMMSDSAYISANSVSRVLRREDRGRYLRMERSAPFDMDRTLAEMTHDIVESVLRSEGMNQTKAARRLGISRSTLWRMIRHRGSI